MADKAIPYKACYLAFAIQDAKGSAAASPTVAYPLPEGGGINPLKNLTFFHWADGNYGVAHYMSEGEWNEGTITIPVIPGYTFNDTDDNVIYKALFGRQDGACYYNDGYYMTVWRVLGCELIEKFADVRITEGTLNLEAQSFVSLELNCVGITDVETDTDPEEDPVTVDPYVFNNAEFEVGYGGAAEAAEDYLRSVTMEFNNHAVDPAEMITLRDSLNPVDLPFVESTEVSGSMSRIMLNTDLYDDFKAGTEGSLTATLTANSTTCTIELPRLVYTEDPLEIPTEDIMREDSVAFQALASVDGDTDAISVSEE
jgi:hypothetical protein